MCKCTLDCFSECDAYLYGLYPYFSFETFQELQMLPSETLGTLGKEYQNPGQVCANGQMHNFIPQDFLDLRLYWLLVDPSALIKGAHHPLALTVHDPLLAHYVSSLLAWCTICCILTGAQCVYCCCAVLNIIQCSLSQVAQPTCYVYVYFQHQHVGELSGAFSALVQAHETLVSECWISCWQRTTVASS